MNWFPLCNYTHYSLLKGYSKPQQLAKKCADNQYKACGIADYKSISGSVSFFKSCNEYNIKPIIGCSFDRFSLFAKNKKGWFDLIEIVSSLDKNNDLDNNVLISVCNRKNLICVANNESESPIQGHDFYKKSSSLMDIYYTDKQDAPLHRILLCSSMKTTLPKINNKLRLNSEFNDQIFFESVKIQHQPQNPSLLMNHPLNY